MEWISVKDRLPGVNSNAVVVFKYNHTPAVAHFIPHKDGYYFCIGNDVRQSWEPDFWMPLPELPKNEGNVFFGPDCPCGLKITGGSKRA